MRIHSKSLIKRLEQRYPPHLAEDWDNVGFQIGNIDRVIDKVLVCLEVTDEVIDEAIEKCIDLIVAHHPLIFKAPKTLAEHNPKASLMVRLIKEDINLYVMHTNFDYANGGLSDYMANQIGLQNIEPLNPVNPEKLYKVIVYIPSDHADNVMKAAFNAGAGQLGNYANCGFSSKGSGTFKPLDGANPAIGVTGQLESVEEVKFETIVAERFLSKVLKAIESVHPYEEVAVDVLLLQDAFSESYSLGRVGMLPEALSAEEFAEKLKLIYRIDAIKASLNSVKQIQRVAVISGAGMDFIHDVGALKVDAFVTGDVKYHEVMESLHHRISIFDVGHFESEVVFSSELAKALRDICEYEDYDLVIEASESERSPFVML